MKLLNLWGLRVFISNFFRQCSFGCAAGGVRPGVRPAEVIRRTSGRTSGRTVVGGARVVSGAEKKAFDRGGPVWPPRSNAADDRLGGGLGGLCPPSQNSGGLGGSAPQPKPKNFEEYDYL